MVGVVYGSGSPALRQGKVTTWARVQVREGEKRVLSVPVVITGSWLTAQVTAFS